MNWLQPRASYTSSKAMVESSEASLRNAKIELGYCSVVAPISGMIGISKFKVGDYVSKGSDVYYEYSFKHG